MKLSVRLRPLFDLARFAMDPSAVDDGDAARIQRLGPANRPTGQEIFDSKTKAEQDEMLGPEAAEKVRSGETRLQDLVATSSLATADDFITQTPAKDV